MPRLIACRAQQFAALGSLPGQVPCRGKCFATANLLLGLSPSSRQAPLAGALSLVLHTLFLNGFLIILNLSLAVPRQALPRDATTARAQVGVLVGPYSSTPTGAPGPGPHTVPSVVGLGPNSARAHVRPGKSRNVSLPLNRTFPHASRVECGAWGACVPRTTKRRTVPHLSP